MMRIVCTVLIVIVFPCTAYNPQVGWWVSLVGCALIVSLARFAWPTCWAGRIGFRVSGPSAAGAALLFVASAWSAFSLLTIAARGTLVQFVSAHDSANFGQSVLFTAGQTLSEEIVLGALLLFSLSRKLRRWRPIVISVGAAAIFAMLHYAFYAVRTSADFNAGRLTVVALTALCLVGVLRNNLILGCRHIFFAWALHFGWNVNMFRGEFRLKTGQQLNEPQRLNDLLTHPLILGVIVLGVLTSAWLFRGALFTSPAAGTEGTHANR